MNAVNSNSTRATIIKVPDATPGILLLNGKQYSFTLEGVWNSAVAPAPNQVVTVQISNTGVVSSITVVDQQQIAKEKFAELSGVAQEHGKVVAAQLQSGIGALAARMGVVALAATVVIWITWFLIPAAGIGGGGEQVASWTFRTLLGTDMASPESMSGAANSRGLLRLIGFLAILAPFVAPFIRTPWSRYLNAAPLAIVVLGWIVIHQSMSGTFGAMGADNPFSYKWGFYLLVIACLVLATGALKKPVPGAA
jgi:hypothetical protein